MQIHLICDQMKL